MGLSLQILQRESAVSEEESEVFVEVEGGFKDVAEVDVGSEAKEKEKGRKEKWWKEEDKLNKDRLIT